MCRALLQQYRTGGPRRSSVTSLATSEENGRSGEDEWNDIFIPMAFWGGAHWWETPRSNRQVAGDTRAMRSNRFVDFTRDVWVVPLENQKLKILFSMCAPRLFPILTLVGRRFQEFYEYRSMRGHLDRIAHKILMAVMKDAQDPVLRWCKIVSKLTDIPSEV